MPIGRDYWPRCARQLVAETRHKILEVELGSVFPLVRDRGACGTQLI